MLSYFSRTPKKILIGLIALMLLISTAYLVWSYSDQVRRGEVSASLLVRSGSSRGATSHR